jgi:hypothetical protein
MASLGIDIGGVDDIDPTLNFVDPATAAAQAVMTTLLHDAGLLWWAPTVGEDIKKYLHKPFDEEAIERSIVRQSQLDERIESATATAEERIVQGNTGPERVFFFTGNLVLTNNAGNVDFTISVSQAGEVLNATVT